MKKELTLGQVLSIFVPVFILILGWAFTLSSRIESIVTINDSQGDDIKTNSLKIEKVDDKVDQNYKEVIDKLDKILYEIKRDNNNK